jgi:putative uncharacterized protein (fragment)
MTACGKKNQFLFGKEVVNFESQANAISKLGDAIDMAVVDSIMAKYFEKQSKGDLKALDNLTFGTETFAVGAKKGSAALIEKINEGLINVAKDENKIKEVYGEYGVEQSYRKADLAKKEVTNNATDSSWDKIVKTKKLVIGVTLLEPASYGDVKDFKGYETNLAKAVVKYLNEKYKTDIEIEFKVIKWSNKENEIASGSIDLIWNNFTVNEERKKAFELSYEYMENKQMPIVKAKDAAKYKNMTVEQLKKNKKLIVGVESGSSAEDLMIPKKG